MEEEKHAVQKGEKDSKKETKIDKHKILRELVYECERKIEQAHEMLAGLRVKAKVGLQYETNTLIKKKGV